MAKNESKKSRTGSPSQTQSKNSGSKDNEYRVKELSATSNVKACIHSYEE